MKFINPCFICLKQKQNPDLMLCSECVAQFDKYKFYSCPRCSYFDCTGCSKLNEFRTIFCLYTYNNQFSKIIVNAKDKFNLNYKTIFYEIFYEPVKKLFLDIFTHHKYDYILLAPYKKERIFYGLWHPNLLFEKILNEIKIQSELNFEIISPHFQNVRKTEIFISNNFTQKISHPKILLCDDVLTTGKTAILTQKAGQEIFKNVTWDLLTIFRAPQKN